jgi:hypothetical protein
MADDPMTAMGRLAAAISSAARAITASGAGGKRRRLRRRRDLLVRGRERHVFWQIDMHRPLRLAQRDPDGLRQGLDDAPLLERQRRLGDRLEQRMMVDPHLDAPAELVGVEVAGDRDHRRAIEIGRSDSGGEIGRAGSERCDAKPGRAGHAAGDIGGEAGRALVGGEHEVDPALAHRLHQRQHVAAGNPEAAGDAIGPQSGDDEISVVHASAAIIYVCPNEAGCSDCCRTRNRRSRITAPAVRRGSLRRRA